jgi:DNA-binding transcriptional ArsR family regulator
VGIPANSLSFHLKTMRAAGLVSVVQEGRYQRYRANVAHMLRLLAFVTENCCYRTEPVRTGRSTRPDRGGLKSELAKPPAAKR